MREDDYKVKRIRGGIYDGYYEITYKGNRIEAGGPFCTRQTAEHLMQCTINEARENARRRESKCR